MLFFICVVLVSPISLIDNLQPLVDLISKELGEKNYIAVMLQTYMAPIMMLAFNSGILPLFIDIIAYLEDHKTKSNK